MSAGTTMGDEIETEGETSEIPISEFLTGRSLQPDHLLTGASYTYFSDIPPFLKASCPTDSTHDASPGPACVIGIDEAGRGPVLGPMVYGVFFLPIGLSDSLLRKTHQFDDSKLLTPSFRTKLVREICTPGTDLHDKCGWAVSVLSARDICSNMMKPGSAYNLNEQAMDATITLINGVYEKGIHVKEIYVDTIGKPDIYQKKLEGIFPSAKIIVAKKADSLYPCVSAASVCAKVTRDTALELLFEHFLKETEAENHKSLDTTAESSWGSGYPSDTKCTAWLKRNIDPVFGWGAECRFSWGTAKNILDQKDVAVRVEWPDEEENSQIRQYFGHGDNQETDELSTWFGRSVETSLL